MEQQLINIGNLAEGTRVHYAPKFGYRQNGIVKCRSSYEHAVFVVYKCNGDWKNFENYTAELTDISDLKQGWI